MKPQSRIEISRSNILWNIQQFKRFLSPKQKLVAVIKANAYGHGIQQVISCVDSHVDYYQVDDFEELEIAHQYTAKPILVLGYVPQYLHEHAVARNAHFTVYDLETLNSLNECGKKYNKRVPVHIKVDALLGRQGIVVEDVASYIEHCSTLSHIHIEALYSHFSNIEDTDDLSHAHSQHTLLLYAQQCAREKGIDVPYHIAATSGILSDPKHAWGSCFVRLGIGMYGLWPSAQLKSKYKDLVILRPVMRWVSYVAQSKKVPGNFPIGYGLSYITTAPTSIAVIPQGYSDGYDRHLSNNSEVLIQGKACPVIGRIMMNMIVVNTTDISHVVAEEEVVLLGKQREGYVSAEYLADRSDTISYEIVSRISPQLPRIVV